MPTQKMVSTIVITALEPGQYTYADADLATNGVPVAATRVMPDRSTPIVVEHSGTDYIVFLNAGTETATAVFRAEIDPSTLVPPQALQGVLLWQGGGTGGGQLPDIVDELPDIVDEMELWVSINGSDEGGDGSQSSPFWSIPKALESIAGRTLRNLVRIFVDQGSYGGFDISGVKTGAPLSNPNSSEVTFPIGISIEGFVNSLASGSNEASVSQDGDNNYVLTDETADFPSVLDLGPPLTDYFIRVNVPSSPGGVGGAQAGGNVFARILAYTTSTVTVDLLPIVGELVSYEIVQMLTNITQPTSPRMPLHQYFDAELANSNGRSVAWTVPVDGAGMEFGEINPYIRIQNNDLSCGQIRIMGLRVGTHDTDTSGVPKRCIHVEANSTTSDSAVLLMNVDVYQITGGAHVPAPVYLSGNVTVVNSVVTAPNNITKGLIEAHGPGAIRISGTKFEGHAFLESGIRGFDGVQIDVSYCDFENCNLGIDLSEGFGFARISGSCRFTTSTTALIASGRSRIESDTDFWVLYSSHVAAALLGGHIRFSYAPLTTSIYGDELLLDNAIGYSYAALELLTPTIVSNNYSSAIYEASL